MNDAGLEGITHTIQLAIAPVFLLSAIAALISVLSTRLGRVVDRARRVEALALTQIEEARRKSVEELKLLSLRARLIHAAFVGATCAALLVCLLIAVAFVGYLFAGSFGVPMAILFVLALTAIMISLMLMLREIFLAVASLEFGLPVDAKQPVV